MKNLKKIFTVAIALACTVVMAACGGSSEGKNLSAEQIANEIKASYKTDTELIELTDNTLSNYYDIDDEDVAEYKVYTSTAFTSEEIAVFKASSSDKVKGINEAANERKEEIIDNFEDYIPEQYELAKENTKIVSKGEYVLLVTGEKANVDKAVEVFEKLLK